MRLRNIIGLVLLGNLLLAAALYIAVSRLVILPGFVKIEEDTVLRNLNRSKDAIARELYHLEILT